MTKTIVEAPKKTKILIVLDSSGSMETGKEITISGFNEQVDIIKKHAKDGGETTVSLMTFSSPPVKMTYFDQAVGDLKKLNNKNYVPEGYTALYDAIGLGIAAIEESIMGDTNTAVLVAVFTDGDENSSQVYTSAQLKKKLSQLEEAGNWTFTLMGPKAGVSEMADILGIERGNVAGFDPSSESSRSSAFEAMVSNSKLYMSERSLNKLKVSAMYSKSAPDMVIDPDAKA